MKTAKDYYVISVLDGMLVTDKESVIEAIQMVIDDAEREKIAYAVEVLEKCVETRYRESTRRNVELTIAYLKSLQK